MVDLGKVGGDAAQPDAVDLLGYPVLTGSRVEVIKVLTERMIGRIPTHVVTLNPEMVSLARRDKHVRDAICAADMYVADGVGIIWASRMLRCPGVTRYPGVELAFDLMKNLAERSGSVYLLGSDPGIAEAAAAKLEADNPGLVIAGVRDGFFTDREAADVVKGVASTKPDLLLVGMGCPKQEAFIARHRRGLNVPLMIGVGGSLEVYAGQQKRAPQWARRSGLEWAFRSLIDASRLRRLGILPDFIATVLREAVRRAA